MAEAVKWCDHAAVAVDADDDEGRVLAELLRGSFQQDSVKQQRLTPGWGQRLRQHLSRDGSAAALGTLSHLNQTLIFYLNQVCPIQSRRAPSHRGFHRDLVTLVTAVVSLVGWTRVLLGLGWAPLV